MELCEGSLKDYVEGKLESIPKDSLDEKILIGQVALGLAYIHDKGIIHKDLKLENILLKRHSPRLVLAKIADFGFAKELKPGQSEFSETEHPGTDTYMAPELLNAPDDTYPASFASDVYALGITIARIVLKGEHPFSSNKFRRQLSMANGLVPQNLEGLGWDLIDLILKLTEKDSEKRPKMILVLRHPYFVLTNDQTKRHFSDQFWADFTFLPEEDEIKRKKNIFSNHNFQEWYETLSKDKPKTTKEIENMADTLKLFTSLRPGVHTDTLFPAKQYQKTIKKAIKSEYDAKNQINQMVAEQGFPQNLSWHRLYKLIQRAPKVFVPYLWSNLPDIVSHSKPMGNSIIPELEWCSLYYDDEELIDELWNIKYSENSENSRETISEIIGMACKCNISERVWSSLLNQNEVQAAAALVYSAIQSSASNAAKVTEMILQRCGITGGMSKIVQITACNGGDWAAEIMQVVLKHGGEPNAPSPPNGWTPLHYAAQNPSHQGPKIVELLLQQGGDPNAKSTVTELTPIHLAALNQGDDAAEILKQLLDSGGAFDAVVEAKDGFIEPIHLATMNIGESALKLLDLLLKKKQALQQDINAITEHTEISLVHLAIFNNGDCGSKILKKLIENGAFPNTYDKEKRTPLHYAVDNEEHKDIEIITILLENGSDPNAVDEWGLTPVHYAAENEGEHAHEKVKLLLASGGDLTIKDKKGFTPVHYALLNVGMCGNEIRKLVSVDEQKANTHINNNGETLLHRISRSDDQIKHVQLILDNGGNLNAVDNLGRSPLHYAVNQNESSACLAVLQQLLQNGGDPNLPDKKRMTPVHYAAESVSESAPEKIKILLENGGDANVSGYNGLTPLHFAGANLGIHGTKLIEILIEYGGNPNTVDEFGRSSVHTAVFQKETVVLSNLQLLLKNGGDPNLIDKKEQCFPIHYAADSVSETAPEQMKILLENGGDANVSGLNGTTPLHFAALNLGIHGTKLTRLLLEHGGNPNIFDVNKRIPLHLAILSKNDQSRLDTIKLLLEKGGNPNASDIMGMTPVHYVIQDNRSNSLKVLTFLLKYGGSILQEDNLGRTPYRLATQNGSKQYCHPEVKKCIVRTYRKMK